MDRVWLLTWTTYGTRLPGDRRGSMAHVKVGIDRRQTTRLEERSPVLENASRGRMRGRPVLLSSRQAQTALADFRSSADYRDWELFAASVMPNHVHLVVAVPADPDPADMLRVFKAYASRALNKRFDRPPAGTWWTASGSRRRLPDEPAVIQAIRYVLNQPGVLAMWGVDPEVRFT